MDTRKLQVQYYLKFANPLFALIMAMMAVPFGFLVGNRGAMTGIGVSIVIAISYLGIQPLFEKVGDVGLLAAGHGGVVARRDLRAGGHVSAAPDAELSGYRPGAAACARFRPCSHAMLIRRKTSCSSNGFPIRL